MLHYVTFIGMCRHRLKIKVKIVPLLWPSMGLTLLTTFPRASSGTNARFNKLHLLHVIKKRKKRIKKFHLLIQQQQQQSFNLILVWTTIQIPTFIPLHFSPRLHFDPIGKCPINNDLPKKFYKNKKAVKCKENQWK